VPKNTSSNYYRFWDRPEGSVKGRAVVGDSSRPPSSSLAAPPPIPVAAGNKAAAERLGDLRRGWIPESPSSAPSSSPPPSCTAPDPTVSFFISLLLTRHTRLGGWQLAGFPRIWCAALRSRLLVIWQCAPATYESGGRGLVVAWTVAGNCFSSRTSSGSSVCR
jgi:hypothetical protein